VITHSLRARWRGEDGKFSTVAFESDWGGGTATSAPMKGASKEVATARAMGKRRKKGVCRGRFFPVKAGGWYGKTPHPWKNPEGKNQLPGGDMR